MKLIEQTTTEKKYIDTKEFEYVLDNIFRNIEFEMIDNKIYAIIEGKKYKLINNVIKFTTKYYRVKDYIKYCYHMEDMGDNYFAKVYEDNQYLIDKYINQCSDTIDVLNNGGNTFPDMVNSILEEHSKKVYDYNSAMKIIKKNLKSEIKSLILGDIDAYVIYFLVHSYN